MSTKKILKTRNRNCERNFIHFSSVRRHLLKIVTIEDNNDIGEEKSLRNKKSLSCKVYPEDARIN